VLSRVAIARERRRSIEGFLFSSGCFARRD
jgi:hypothetical protein